MLKFISYPFPDSNVHSTLYHKTFYSQLLKFYRLCNNRSNFLFYVKLIYHKLINRGYEYINNRWCKSFTRFINLYNDDTKYSANRQ